MKALYDHRMLPRVLCGSSVGSIVASIIGTHTDDELGAMIDHLADVSGWKLCVCVCVFSKVCVVVRGSWGVRGCQRTRMTSWGP